MDTRLNETGLLNRKGIQVTVGQVSVIASPVVEDELHALAEGMKHVLRFESLPAFNPPEARDKRAEIQMLIDRIECDEPDTDVIVIADGGAEELVGRLEARASLVLPRASDCTSLLVGDEARRQAYMTEHPGTYWYSPGWLKFNVPPGKRKWETLHEEYMLRMGEENADCLMDTEQHVFDTYKHAAFVDCGVAVTDSDVSFTRECAEWLGWSFDHVIGNPAWLHDLLTGPWDDRRFIVKPGARALVRI